MLEPRRQPERARLGTDTAGAVHLDDCRAAGMTDRQLHQLVRSDRWQSPFQRVYVTFSGPIPPVTLHWAALLYAGDGAVLSHESAGWFWRLCRQPSHIHVTVPYGRSVRSQQGLVIHRSRTLVASDVHPALVPKRMRIERTVIDLLTGSNTAEQALSLVANAVKDRATTTTRIAQALNAAPRTRWRSAVLLALPDVRAGAQSVLELKDAAMRRSHGLPQGQRQHGRRSNGVEYLDVMIEEFQLHIELDGRLGHDRAQEIWRDMRRDNRSEVAGLRHLRYGWSDMIDRACEVAREQAEILRQQGWRGQFMRCRRCPTNL